MLSLSTQIPFSRSSSTFSERRHATPAPHLIRWGAFAFRARSDGGPSVLLSSSRALNRHFGHHLSPESVHHEDVWLPVLVSVLFLFYLHTKLTDWTQTEGLRFGANPRRYLGQACSRSPLKPFTIRALLRFSPTRSESLIVAEQMFPRWNRRRDVAPSI